MDLTKIQRLMMKTKLTVNGHIHYLEKSLSISIPEEVMGLILLFYGDQVMNGIMRRDVRMEGEFEMEMDIIHGNLK